MRSGPVSYRTALYSHLLSTIDTLPYWSHVQLCISDREPYQYSQGRTGGPAPQNLRWGTAHASVPPNILRSSVIVCAQKYEQSKKRCFSCEERVIYDI